MRGHTWPSGDFTMAVGTLDEHKEIADPAKKIA